MSEARVNQFTYQGISVTAIVADVPTIDVADVGNTNVYASSYYGCNGGYFNRDSPTKDLVAIVCKAGGAPVRNGGDAHNYGDFSRGTMICTKSSSGNLFLSTDVISNLNGYQKESIQWAVGGLSLHLDKAYTDKEWLDDITASEHAGRVGAMGANSTSARTAIGYRSTDNKIILVSIMSATPGQVRSLMKTYIGCKIGVMLDGSNSSQIKGKTAGGQDVLAGFGNVTQLKQGPGIYSMVTVTPSRWVNSTNVRK
ncbi:hypothetical protein K493DRAFT_354888 [Basidiobolus meristosporus CBS 931.73]|uniref:Phosphodiester glycosidase domain-containing protein n=1 Tax=Basidiobolus meristosporus CBS 931.73 TaxID=1314790 RepID=A0A1Y1Y290_9FUNG|nr:hypothetical protein K493DRAFT_303599 [Basidiobolus meristosporus CBS 931.73]ORX92092.1 hypothetical protein K493DRAFT_354888 [Basidiobolus meristosporus CBS 931.73]|eukprot:ORX92089.1 hypothetical protein K493DRAFT_303599 [Basidiobolus meristosporus CBS 931.73]